MSRDPMRYKARSTTGYYKDEPVQAGDYRRPFCTQRGCEALSSTHLIVDGSGRRPVSLCVPHARVRQQVLRNDGADLILGAEA